MTAFKKRLIHDTIINNQGQTVTRYAELTRIVNVEINTYLNNDVDGRELVKQGMVARPLRGRLPAWAMDDYGQARPNLPESNETPRNRTLVVLPDVPETGIKVVDQRNNRLAQDMREMSVARSHEKQCITDRFGSDLNALADLYASAERERMAYMLTCDALKSSADVLKESYKEASKAKDDLSEAKDEIIRLLKKG